MAYDPSLSHFDIDMARGAQGELWVSDVVTMLAQKSGEIEVKTDFRFAETKRFYVERECRGRDGVWRPSGLNATKARLWAIKLADLPGCLIIDTDWMRRAVARAAQHPKNLVECKYGANPTRGVLVFWQHLLDTMTV